jgi:hypothetical protein
MKNLLIFLKLTAQGGLLVLMPFLLFILLLKEMVELVVGLATPIADLFRVDTFEDLRAPSGSLPKTASFTWTPAWER